MAKQARRFLITYFLLEGETFDSAFDTLSKEH